jgi:hypothetical protein
MISYFPVVTGSLTVEGSVNISGGITASGGITISGSIASASFASTASFVALAQSASNAVSAQTASFANTLTVAGNLTAQTLVVQTITSSVDFVTGSTRFGSVIGNTHIFTGSMSVSGSGAFIGIVGVGGATEAGWSLKSNGNLKVENSNGTTVLQVNDTSTGGKAWSLISAGAGNAHSVAAGTFYLRNSSDSSTAFTIASTGAATFLSSVTATSAFFNASNGFGLAGRNAANTQYRNLIILNSGNQIEIGRDTDISQIRLGTASANDALTIASNGVATFSSAVRAANFGLERASSFRGGLYTYDAVTGTGTDYGVTIFAEGGTNNGNIYFCPNGSVTRVMTINTSSNVLINTVSSIAPGGITYRLEVNGPAHMTELSLGDSYNRSVSTDSSWSSFQTIIPVNTLEVYAVYLITASYTVNGSPYNVVTSFTFVTPNCNGGSADNEFLPICSTHQGGTGTMSFRAVAASSQQSGGLQVKFNGFGNLNGTLVLRATRLKRNIG